MAVGGTPVFFFYQGVGLVHFVMVVITWWWIPSGSYAPQNLRQGTTLPGF